MYTIFLCEHVSLPYRKLDRTQTNDMTNVPHTTLSLLLHSLLPCSISLVHAPFAPMKNSAIAAYYPWKWLVSSIRHSLLLLLWLLCWWFCVLALSSNFVLRTRRTEFAGIDEWNVRSYAYIVHMSRFRNFRFGSSPTFRFPLRRSLITYDGSVWQILCTNQPNFSHVNYVANTATQYNLLLFSLSMCVFSLHSLVSFLVPIVILSVDGICTMYDATNLLPSNLIVSIGFLTILLPFLHFVVVFFLWKIARFLSRFLCMFGWYEHLNSWNVQWMHNMTAEYVHIWMCQIVTNKYDRIRSHLTSRREKNSIKWKTLLVWMLLPFRSMSLISQRNAVNPFQAFMTCISCYICDIS